MTRGADLPRLRAVHRRRRDRDRRHLRHHQVAPHRRGLVRDRRPRVPARRGDAASAPTATCRCMAQLARRRGRVRWPSPVFFGSLLADRRPHICWSRSSSTLVFSFFFTSVAANAIATIARNPGVGHDDADRDHLVGGAAAVRRERAVGHVLRHGHRRHGVHGAVGVGADDHRPQDRLLAGLDARRCRSA